MNGRYKAALAPFGGLAIMLPLLWVVQPVNASPMRAQAATPVIVAGTEGGNMRPLLVSIYADGRVTANWGDTTSTTISRDAVAALLTLARAEHFDTLPPRIVGKGLPDIGGRYITIRDGGVVKTVHVRFVRNHPFDQLYAVLMAVARQPA